LIEKTEKELEKHTIVYQREKAKKQKEQPIRSALPAHLPRVEQIIELYFPEIGRLKIKHLIRVH
jgi:hypothetical protein